MSPEGDNILKMAESLSDSLSRRGMPVLKESDVSPSPSPLSSAKLFLDVELEQLADFNGVTLGVCAMNKKVCIIIYASLFNFMFILISCRVSLVQ